MDKSTKYLKVFMEKASLCFQRKKDLDVFMEKTKHFKLLMFTYILIPVVRSAMVCMSYPKQQYEHCC